MTDKEIIKALECLFGCVDCRECLYSPRYEFPLCQQQVAKDTRDLINRQQAEIEQLKKKVEELSEVLSDSIRIKYKEVQSEAIEEFAEKVKANKNKLFNYIFSSRGFDEQIDNLVKEYEKGSEGK